MVSLGKKGYQKHPKNDFATVLELMCGKKNPRKKHQIFEKKKLTREDNSTRSEVVDDLKLIIYMKTILHSNWLRAVQFSFFKQCGKELI